MPFLNHDPPRPFCCYGNLLRHENMPACLSQVMEFFDTLIVVKVLRGVITIHQNLVLKTVLTHVKLRIKKSDLHILKNTG